MANWIVKPDSTNNSLKGTLDRDGGIWTVEQDERPFIEEVKRERENQKQKLNSSAMKKFCTIPDLVAIEILTKYGLDIHSPLFTKDVDAIKKLKTIIMMEYPYLVVNNA